MSLLLAGTQLPVLLKAGQLRVCGGVCTHTGVCKRVQYGERCFASITSMGSTEFPCKGLWGRQEHEAANGLGWVRTALQDTRRGISVPLEAGEREEGVGRCVTGPQDNPQVDGLLEGLTELRKAVTFTPVTSGTGCPLNSAGRCTEQSPGAACSGPAPSGTAALNSVSSHVCRE